MVEKFRAQLKRWEREASVEAVLIKGTGEKAFCAGGDIRWLADAARKDAGHASGFFREEYRLNAAIHHLTKPYVALIDGIVMGGGVGVSVHGDFRVAGDRTLFAMPETGIGLFPDVGGGYFCRCFMAASGFISRSPARAPKAADCMAAGVATHYTPTRQDGRSRSGSPRSLLRLARTRRYQILPRRLFGRPWPCAAQRYSPRDRGALPGA
ncbi:MAG: enoyl-CoA hydratase/isomerase family protein [Parvularculaceae bacterium]